MCSEIQNGCQGSTYYFCGHKKSKTYFLAGDPEELQASCYSLLSSYNTNKYSYSPIIRFTQISLKKVLKVCPNFITATCHSCSSCVLVL